MANSSPEAFRWRIEPEDFERDYAQRSGISVARLRELGRIVAPCLCGHDYCPGWQSISRQQWEQDEWYRGRNDGQGWTWPPEEEEKPHATSAPG